MIRQHCQKLGDLHVSCEIGVRVGVWKKLAQVWGEHVWAQHLVELSYDLLMTTCAAIFLVRSLMGTD